MHEAAENKASQTSLRSKRGDRLRGASTVRACFVVALFHVVTVGWSVDARGADPPAADTLAQQAPPIEVVVHGASGDAPVGPRDTSVASAVIRRERLVGPGIQPQDVLRSQPGVTVTESGGFGSPATAAIRGATAADTPVYLSGVRLNDDVGGTADLSLVPLWLIDHVEVYRGHAPLDADRLAPGGAIFFEPRRPTKNMGGVGYYGGSWGVSKGWAYAGNQLRRINALVGVSADRASNRYSFVNDHGTLFNLDNATLDHRRNADERTLEGWGLARVDLGNGATLDILANEIVREQGVPRLALLQTRQAREQSSRTLASIGLKVPLDDERRHVFLSRTSLLIGRAEYDDPLLELNLRTQNLSVIGRRVEQSIGSTLDVTDSIRLHPALNIAHERIERIPDNIPLGRAHREFFRPALGAQHHVLDWLTLHALASGECHHTGAKKGTTCDTLEPTGRFGVEFGSGHLRLLANVGRYVRVPTLGEMYGVSGTLHGNTSLVPETSRSLDFGFRARPGSGTWLQGAYLDAFVFSRWAEGLIAYTHAGEGFMVPYNVGHARLMGAELLTGLRITPILLSEVSATVIEPRDATPGRTTVNDILPYRSRLIVAPRLRADWKRTDPPRDGLSGLGGELRALYQSSRYADPGGLGVIAEQISVDLELSASMFKGLLTLRGRIVDLFDAKRTDIIGYPLPGRSGYFGLEATW
jgi:vitamin B12 transporter